MHGQKTKGAGLRESNAENIGRLKFSNVGWVCEGWDAAGGGKKIRSREGNAPVSVGQRGGENLLGQGIKCVLSRKKLTPEERAQKEKVNYAEGSVRN